MTKKIFKLYLRKFLIHYMKRQYMEYSFIRNLGYKPDFDNPKSFNEKINWFKLYGFDKRYTPLADKISVRSYIEDKIGNEYLVPIYGIYKSGTELIKDIRNLPVSFVLKSNHGSGQVFICKDKDSINWNMQAKILDNWLNINYYDYTGEWQYRDINPYIICEQLLDEYIIDYKYYCFAGKVEFLYISKGWASNNAKVTFFDVKGAIAPFQRLDHEMLEEEALVFPPNMSKMIYLAERLSEGFPFVRVDLYSVNEKIYFSELTFTPCNGYMPFKPREWDYKLGAKWKLDTEEKHKQTI